MLQKRSKNFIIFITAFLTAGLWVSCVLNNTIAQEIYVNQIGYYPSTEKYALIENPGNAGIAEIIESKTNKVIMNAEIHQPIIDKFTGNKVSKITFDSLKTPGDYFIKYKNNRSFDFRIEYRIYNTALKLTTSTFYLQNCGREVKYKNNTLLHPPCHRNDGYIKRTDSYNTAETKIDATGGWHDAGDYGKYIASTTIAAALLMATSEINTETKQIHMYYKDNDSDLPDILEETRYALDWMLKLQREDGAVYRKCSGENWPSDTTLAQDDTQKRYIYGISSQETGKFAATMAKASRIFRNYNTESSDKYLNAAIKAWNHMITFPNNTDYQSSDNSGSGGYPDPNYDTERFAYSDQDELVWASAELYLATKDPAYLNYFKNNVDRVDYDHFSWKNTAIMGIIEIATSDCKDLQLKESMKQLIIKNASNIVAQMSSNPYFIPMDKFRWASNATILSEGITLAYAYKLTGKVIYKDYGLKTINYVFGCNPLNKSFVTGLGDNPPQNIHHRYMMATGETLPGFMVGGPNDTANDNVAIPGLKIKSYIDNKKSYATNEYAIDYNAPLVFMLAWAESLK
jgi:endoglucanase